MSVADDDESDLAEQLDTLEDVNSVARDGAIDPESQVSVILHRELVRVEPKENLPEQVAGAVDACQIILVERTLNICLLASHQAKNGEEGNARAPTQSAHRETLMVSDSMIQGQKTTAYPTPKGPRISVVMR